MLDIILSQISNNFNFSYIIIVNILTYIIISIIDKLNGRATVSFWQKRLVLLFSIIVIGVIYYLIDNTIVIPLVNSAIAAPVFWSWILKPIISKTPFDYKKIDKYLRY